MSSTDALSLVQKWEPQVEREDLRVETLDLRSGVTLVLSSLGPGTPRAFSFSEPEDMFGFGFHLHGGACFRLESQRFETAALDVWACAAPAGAASHFVLPREGFRTVAIRFDPRAAAEYFDGGGALPRRPAEMLTQVSERTAVARLSSMPATAAARLQSMFTTGYGGAARRLYLESCALEVLAGQLGAAGRESAPSCPANGRHRDRALAARAYLDVHYRDPPTIPELARIVGTNEFALKRAFKAVCGTTLFAYVSRRRMEQAALLLREGMTVTMAAQEVGYECARSFSAAFRRQFGRAPSSVRRATR